MLETLKKIEKLLNSELTTKVQKTTIENDELLIEIEEKDLIEVIQFIKSNENEFFSYLDTNTLFISDSYESWFLRLIIFGGVFLALVYIYPFN